MSKRIYGILGVIILALAVIAIIAVSCDNNGGVKTTEVSLNYIDSENISLYQSTGIVEGEVTPEVLFQALMASLPGVPNVELLIPEGTYVIGSEVDEEGQMLLNLSPEFAPGIGEGMSYGNDVDTLIVMSIVNTMIDNFEGVKSVKIIVNGVEVPMYKRAVYLNDFIKKNALLNE